MLYSLLFAFAMLLTLALPCAATVLVFEFARRPAHGFLRFLLAVSSGWILFFSCAVWVYRPAGIAHGHAQGVHFPEGLYDNNVGAVALVAGWIYPLLGLTLFKLLRLLWWISRGHDRSGR